MGDHADLARMAHQVPDLGFNFLRMRPVIGIMGGDKLPRGLLQPAVACPVGPAIPVQPPQHNARIGLCHAVDNPAGRILTGVIHHDDFKIGIALGAKPGQRRGDTVLCLKGRQDDRHLAAIRRPGHRASRLQIIARQRCRGVTQGQRHHPPVCEYLIDPGQPGRIVWCQIGPDKPDIRVCFWFGQFWFGQFWFDQS